MRREARAGRAAERGLLSRVELVLVVTVLVGAGFLLWSWLWRTGPSATTCTAPAFQLSTSPDGRRVGRFDEGELARAFQARGLPAPDPPFAPIESVALEHFAAAIERLCQEPSAATYGRLGQILHFYRRYDLAQAAYAEALRRDPTDARWPHYLGCVALESDEVVAAEARFRAAIALDPEALAGRLHLARLLESQGRLDEAAVLLDACVERDPGSLYVLTERARLELLGGRPQEAVERLSQVLGRDPKSQQAHQLLSRAWMQLGEPARAKEHADRVVAGVSAVQDPVPDPLLRELVTVSGSVSHFELLAGEHLAAGRDGDAVAALEILVERSPTVDGRSLLARMYLKTRRIEEAVQVIDRLAELHPDQPHAFSLRSVHAFMERRYDDALRFGEQALKRDPAYHSAHRQLAQTHWALGSLDEGIVHARSAARLDPGDVGSQYLLGELCFMARLDSEAQLAFRAALLLEPTLEAARQRLVALENR